MGSPLEIVNKSMKVNEKETILITCKSRPRLFSKLSWLKDGKNVSEGVVGISDPQLSHVTRSVLKIDSATLNDTGNYTCIGHGWRGGVVLTNATIIVKSMFILLTLFTVGSTTQKLFFYQAAKSITNYS